MSDKKLSVTIEAENREDLIYWLERLTERLREYRGDRALKSIFHNREKDTP